MENEFDYLNDKVFQRLQFELRAAYEEGWRDAGGDPARSPSDEAPKGWRAAWMKSRARKFLVANNLITGDDGYK